MQTKKIWLAKLQANGAKTIQVLLISSFGPFGEIKGMSFF